MSATFVTSSSSLSPWHMHGHGPSVTSAGLSSSPAWLQPSPVCMQRGHGSLLNTLQLQMHFLHEKIIMWLPPT